MTKRSASISSAGCGRRAGDARVARRDDDLVCRARRARRRARARGRRSRRRRPASIVRPRSARTARGPGPTPTSRTGTPTCCCEEREVVARRGGQVVRLGHRRQVGAPAGQLLVDGRDLVQHRLVVRHVVEALTVELVGDADLHRVEHVEHVELGDRHLAQRVQPHGLPQHHRVEPAGATAATGVRAELVTALDEQVADLVEELGRERSGRRRGCSTPWRSR